MTTVSVIVPAYNEATVIAATLAPMTGQGLDLIVVANGCRDATAQVARTAAPDARVIEQVEGNKSKALNAGLDAAWGQVIVVLDADTLTTPEAVYALADAVQQPGTKLAYGHICFDLSRSSHAVRAFYAAWQHNAYFRGGKVGAFFALQRSALVAQGGFAQVLNDDEWVRRMFGHQSRFVADADYTVKAPRTLTSLIGVRRRVRRGNRALADIGVRRAMNGYRDHLKLMAALSIRPHLWFGALVYAYVTAKVSAAPVPGTEWERDMSNRVQPAEGEAA